MAINSKLPKNLLIARFSALGDVAMTIPVVYSVCRCNPDMRFIFITKPAQEGLFVNPPENLVVRGIDVKEKYRSLGDFFRLFKELRKEYDIDGFADLHGVLRSFMLGITCTLHGVKWRTIRKGRMNKRALTRPRNKIMLPLLSSRARYREVFYGFGYVLEEKFKSIYGDGKGDPAMFAQITPPKQDGEKWIGIAPFAKHKGKIYPVNLMEKVIAELSSQPDVKIFLFGGGEDAAELGGHVDLAAVAADLGKRRYRAVKLRKHRVAVNAHALEEGGDEAAVLIDEGVEQMLRGDIAVAVLLRHGLRGLHRFDSFLSEILSVHKTRSFRY